MRRLVLLSIALVSVLSLSTAVVACGGDDDDDQVDAAPSGEADAAPGGDADAAPDGADAAPEIDAGDPHGLN